MDITHIVKIDLEDIDLLIKYPWYVNGGYIRTVESRKVRLEGRKPISRGMSRIIMARVLSRDLFKDEIVDHINGVTHDNRRSNLRISNKKLNGANQNSFSKNSATGYRNIYKCGKRYRVKLEPNKQRVQAWFDTLEEAITFAKAKREEIWGEHAHYCRPLST